MKRLLTLFVASTPIESTLSDPPVPVLADFQERFTKKDIRFIRLSMRIIGFAATESLVLQMPIAEILEKMEEAFNYSFGCSGNDQIRKMNTRLRAFI